MRGLPGIDRTGANGGEFTLSTTQESLGKVGSLKKNYGGITPEKTRNTKALEQLRRELAAAIKLRREEA